MADERGSGGGAGPPPSLPAPNLPGIDELEVIGRGGYGTVYRGRQAELGRDVAVKVISSTGAHGSVADRWRREVTAMGRLSNHPNIVAVYAGGVTDDGSPYLVMPYVPGGSLLDRLRERGALEAGEVATLGAKLAGALSTTHGAGVLHRDVKPDNVLMSPYGEPQLTDFGIARLVDSATTATGLGVQATVPYAAPEVLSGDAATEAADVYGLGATLFACLAGSPPFPLADGETLVALVGRIASQAPPDLRGRDVPEGLASVVDRALAKTPAERIGTADELRRELVGADLTAPAGEATPPTVALGMAGAEGDPAGPVDSTGAEPSEAWRPADSPGPPVAGPRASTADDPAEPAPSPGRRRRAPAGVLAAIVVPVAVLGIGAALAWVTGDDGDQEARPPSTAAEPADLPASEPEPPPSTEPPPPSTEPPSTEPPPPTTEAPPPTTEPEPDPDQGGDGEDGAAGTAPSSIEGAATSYFRAISSGDLSASYQLLSPEFRAAQSQESYEGFWSSQSVEVVGEPDVDREDRTATVPITINGNREDYPLSFVTGDDGGTWLVDGPRPS